MSEQKVKTKNVLPFVAVYCIVLLFVVIGIRIYEFRKVEHPLEAVYYTETAKRSDQLLININTVHIIKHQLMPRHLVMKG